MTENGSDSGKALIIYIAKKMFLAIVLIVFVIILLEIGIGWVSPPSDSQSTVPPREDLVHPKPVEIASKNTQKTQDARIASGEHASKPVQGSGTAEPAQTMAAGSELGADHEGSGQSSETVQKSRATGAMREKLIHSETAPGHGATSRSSQVATATATHSNKTKTQEKEHLPASDGQSLPAAKSAANTATGHEDTQAHGPNDHGEAEAEVVDFPMVGMAFVDAVISPLEYELNERFYGWRPNDILDFTDNVNNFQLGVLEVTRRSAVILSERISRTGSTAAFDQNLQNAMNWFMIKSDRYWFPSAESKYKDGLKELRTYFSRLEKGEAQFYNRTDNLIPLLMAYQDLLGSCDENLVKFKEDDGSEVSFFKADDYFFYAQGVASALHTILKGIEKDFVAMVDSRGGMEMLHHAITSCHHAMKLDPWVILNSDLSSVFANHRLNMAGPISHARFYLGVLIKALST